ncbi:hypothetical protein BJ878DRAFT_482861 [Calycina marina]|uniref:Uncharacterized protein n=1 Tax=Calycina marina TaxID=1763456 RepID=A0A9P7YXF7_9HELO|nr:hypothetical protein BJ878DRAFT_482861 [Calycina marina]
MSSTRTAMPNHDSWRNVVTIELPGHRDGNVDKGMNAINLDSVTASMEQIPGVDQACVVLRGEDLWAFYSGHRAWAERTMILALVKTQPEHTIPTKWDFRANHPLKPDDVVDEDTLLTSRSDAPTPEGESSREYGNQRREAGQILQQRTTASNLTMAILIRQEYVVNALFKTFVRVPHSMPLWFRYRCAGIFHLGGLHSGSAVAASIWLIVFNIAATVLKADAGVQVVSYITLAPLLAMIISAHPRLRALFHNRSRLFIDLLVGPHLHSSGSKLFSLPTPPAARLHLEESSSKVTLFPGSAVRLSSHPLTERHAFATIAEPGKPAFSVLISNAGDWTNHQIKNSPSKFWVRGIPTDGVMRVNHLFKKVVLVSTGSGIGPCLLVIKSRPAGSLRVFWSAPKPEVTFGKEIIQDIYHKDPEAVIWDTKKLGRPDMIKELYHLYKESEAEAVIIISNQKVTQLVAYGLESRGIPAFGAIADSLKRTSQEYLHDT